MNKPHPNDEIDAIFKKNPDIDIMEFFKKWNDMIDEKKSKEGKWDEYNK